MSNYTVANSNNIRNINPDMIKQMQLMPDQNGDPMMHVQVANSEEFESYGFPLTKGFQIHFCNEFLRSLNLGIDIMFKTYIQYGFLIWNCFDLLQQKIESVGSNQC